MKLRPHCENDLPQLMSLLNEAYREEYEFIPYTDESLQAELKAASSVLLATEEQDGIVGLAYLRQDWYGETVTLCARPGPEQEEIEDVLLSTIAPENKTGHVTAGIDALEQKRIAFFSARGYLIESSLYQMVAELDRSRSLPQIPKGYLIRSLKPDEEEALIRLANAAYDGERLRPGVLAKWEAKDPDFSTDWVQVVEYEGELVAMVRGCSDREYNERYHANRGYLGPAATLAPHRGKGLSRALTVSAMNLLHEHGMKTVCLYTWEGNPAALELIRHLDFRLGHEWKILGKTVR